jgi:hypothetical protein
MAQDNQYLQSIDCRIISSRQGERGVEELNDLLRFDALLGVPVQLVSPTKACFISLSQTINNTISRNDHLITIFSSVGVI